MRALRQNASITEFGGGLLEFFVSASIMLVAMLSMMSAFQATATHSGDEGIKMRTDNEARLLLDYMVYDARIAGSGMPLGQSNFAIGQAGLGNAPLPILLTSDANSLNLRLNEQGISTVLTTDFVPGVPGWNLSLLSTADFEAGDTLYLSDRTTGGTGGLAGIVHSVASPIVTLLPTTTFSSGVTFKAGTLVTRTTVVQYESPADDSGITRNAELGATLLQPRSSFSIRYLDRARGEIVPPLTDALVRDQLAGLVIEVEVYSQELLRDGTNYITTAQQEVALRNLILSR